MDVNGQPRILITRLSAIGDTILTLPMLTTLRKSRPDAFIAWAVEKPTNQFLDLHPDLDAVITVPKGWMTKPTGWSKIRRKLQSYKFNISIDPQGISKSSALGWLSGAKTRVGLRGKWGRELSQWFNNSLVDTESRHIVKRSAELLSAIGIECADLDHMKFGLPVCEQSELSVSRTLDDMGVRSKFVLINPGAGWASRQWEMERWGSVASYLFRFHGLPSLIAWAGDAELEMAKEIHAFDPECSMIAPKTSLLELAALAKQSSFLLSGDTGPMHIASAVGTPVIGLYGSTSPHDSGAYGEQHIAIQKWLQTGERKGSKSDNAAMRDILAGDVFPACDRMVQLTLQRAA